MRTFVCAMLVAVVAAFPADDDRKIQGNTGSCPGGYAEGAEIERGRLVYVCQGGQVVPKACIAEDLSKVPIGGKFDNTHYRRTCQNNGGDLSFEAVSCLQNGQEHKVGESWNDANLVYTCKQNQAEPLLDAVATGCVGEGGKQVNPGEQVAKGDLVYECQPSVNNRFKLGPNGCVKDGKQLKVGETVEIGKFWFNCTKFGRETVSLKAAGCVNGGKRLNDGDRFNENDVVYECVIDANKNDLRVSACVQNDGGNVIERKLGCTWVEGAEPLQYEWTCKYDAAANTATKVQLRCNYKQGNGYHQIEAGCYRVIGGKSAFGCVGESGKSLNLRSFNAETEAQSAGLHAC